MSVGFTNPISGNFGKMFLPAHRSPLGGGIRGFIPQKLLDTDNSSNFAQTRFVLVEAWNTQANQEMRKLGGRKPAQTPFRVVNNAGDLLSRKYYSCGGDCMTPQSRPNVKGIRGAFGAIMSNCDNTGIPPTTCNGKYVYDSSDYTTYLKQKATVKNYDDFSNGGDDYSTSQSAQRHIKRF
jgi:hypothetical protein